MTMIYNFNVFLREKYESDILYMLNNAFDASGLIEFYSEDQIEEWMSKFDFDREAHVVFVSDKKTSSTGFKFGGSDILKNRLFFRPKGKHSGVILPDSEVSIDGNIVSVYLFNRKRNINLRKGARQIHGFSYEYSVKLLNGLKKVGGGTDKWDAFGSLHSSFLEKRICDDYQVDLYDGSKYISLIGKDLVTGYNELKLDNSLFENFEKDRYWNIKSSSTNEINLAGFANISGLDYVNKDGVKSFVHNNSGGEFILNVGQHINGVLINEYIVIIPLDRWTSYLPDFKNPEVMQRITDMYMNLGKHKLIGERDNEEPWKEYISEYSKITTDSIIKLRFKRGKDQLRIQCSLSWQNFIEIILKENIHIRNSSN